MDGDLKPFKHGSEGTHSCCNTRLKEMGGKATCCYCDPHLFCDIKIAELKKKKFTPKPKNYNRTKLF
jgi:hypothetical protein